MPSVARLDRCAGFRRSANRHRGHSLSYVPGVRSQGAGFLVFVGEAERMQGGSGRCYVGRNGGQAGDRGMAAAMPVGTRADRPIA